MNKILLFLIVSLFPFLSLTICAQPGDAHIWLKFRRTGPKPEGWTPPGRERFWGQWNEVNFERKNGQNFVILNMRYHEQLPSELLNADGTLKLQPPPGFEYNDYIENDDSASLPGVPQFERMKFNNPGLTVPLGVGLTSCPLVLDFDGDGVTDLLMSCECRRWNTTHFFRNTGKPGMADPVFAKGVKVGPSGRNPVYTSFNGVPLAQAGRTAYFDFTNNVFMRLKEIALPDVSQGKPVNETTFTYRDFDGDGKDELVIAADIWENVRWDDAYTDHGVWTGGCLKGWTWIAKNRDGDINHWNRPEKLVDTKGEPLTVAGSPRSMFEDFDGDGDLDIIATTFHGSFTYFENVGTRRAPKYAPGRPFFDEKGREIIADSPMTNPVSFDWNGDGRADIICGDESGQVALIENTGKVKNGLPVFKTPRYFRQEADELKFGVLATPAAVDWDGDGDLDFIAGNAAGYIGFIENLSGPGVEKPKFAAPVKLSCVLPKDRKYTHPNINNKQHSVISLDPFCIRAGPSGSIQGPRERAWGYVCLSVADWDGDGLLDIMINNTLGRIFWFKNIGTRTQAKLMGPLDVEVEWKGQQPKLAWGWMTPEKMENPKSILTQWRTTPVMHDWNGDGLMDLILSDTEGYLCLWTRGKRSDGSLYLNPPERVFCRENGNPFRLTGDKKGKSGRTKLCLVDWDGDGKLDLMTNFNNAKWWRQVKDENGKWFFRDMGPVAPNWIQWHTTSPCAADFNADGIPDLVCPSEDGMFYYLRNPRTILAAAERSWKEPKSANKKNLLVNPSFEEATADGAPSGWTVKVYKGKNPYTSAHGFGVNGSGGVKYENADPETFVALKQRVKVEPGHIYSFECQIRPENLKCGDVGAVSTIEWHDAKGNRLGGTTVPNSGIRGNSKLFQMSRPRQTPRLPDTVASAELSIYVGRQATGTCYIDDACFWESTPEPVDALTSDVYRDTADAGEVTFVAGLDLASSKINPKDVKGSFSVVASDGERKRIAATSIESHRACVTVPVKDLARGTHLVAFGLKDAKSGKLLGTSSMNFTRVRKLPPRKVTFDRHGRTLVDGKLFFPLGMYAGEMTTSNVAKYAESVFNFVMPYRMPTKAVMDDCWAHGIRVAYDVRNGTLGWADTDKKVKNATDELFWLRQKVVEFGSHPGLLAWYTNDEFDLSEIRHLTILHRVLQELDPDHPTITCIYQVPNTRGYLPSFDVIGTDPYPIDEAPLSLVTDWTRKTQKGVMGAKPLWQVPQAFDWAYYRKARGGSLEGLRFPTREEMENMGWQAIAAGANGLLFYAFHDVLRNDPAKADARWDDVKNVALAIKAHEATLLSADGPLPAITGETETIVARAYNEKGQIKLLVVNADRKPQTAKLMVGAKSVKVELKAMEAKWLEL